ncbi:uncharacterized protein EV422DRAFT_548662, partial [Fimicolochytrium jonesii]|uniref:uncharacterized protein n=1 Tax=Fimicolochytrium jonesii TaxID=1396493 RepID=UPI0022FDBF44
MGIPRLVPVLSSKLGAALNSKQSSYDGLLVIYSKLSSLLPGTKSAALSPLASAIQSFTQVDASAASSVVVIPTSEAPGNRLVLSPTGSLLGDVDDVRRFTDAARKGLARCRAAGLSKPLVLLADPFQDVLTGSTQVTRAKRDYSKYIEVTLLGLLAEAYVPLQAREHFSALGKPAETIEEIGVAVERTEPDSEEVVDWAVRFATAVEEGRRLAKDIGGADPERMTPLRAAAYIEDAFKGSDVAVTVTKDLEVIKKEYPLLHAVTRASLPVERHHPAVVHLEYHSSDASAVKENVFLIGKGVTYDTGGLDIKAGGVMRGMSRDKCGAAACAGFLKTVSLLKPKHVNVIADLGFVRNSCGSDGYVSDEIIVSRAGVRTLQGNTDAEGRNVMTDLLCAARERALLPRYASVPSRCLTVATLTGHVIRAYGVGYGAALDNGPAREAGIAERVLKAGHALGDPFELSTLRREDYQFVAPGAVTEDVVQANDKASTMTSRGHQFPAAFMSIASGISKHGLDSEHPVSYTHLDVAGCAEEGGSGLSLAHVTGSPVAALVGAFL